MRPTFPFFTMLVLIAIALPVATADPFQDVRNATADVLDSDTAVAGYLLGFFLVVIVVIIGYAAVVVTQGESPGSGPIAFFGMLGMALSVLLTWFPTWVGIIMIMMIAVILVGIPGVTKRESGA